VRLTIVISWLHWSIFELPQLVRSAIISVLPMRVKPERHAEFKRNPITQISSPEPDHIYNNLVARGWARLHRGGTLVRSGEGNGGGEETLQADLVAAAEVQEVAFAEKTGRIGCFITQNNCRISGAGGAQCNASG
jgi:hypothetical protein